MSVTGIMGLCMDGMENDFTCVLCLCADLACVMISADGVMNCMDGWLAIWFNASRWRAW
jgi:hypothetical protein